MGLLDFIKNYEIRVDIGSIILVCVIVCINM